MIKHIVIVGGGSAGWLTAGILAAELQVKTQPEVQITLVESPDVNTIGVGEGTWPSMRATLKKIGLSETEFIKECCASFKQGSKFVGWKNGADNDVYYHPFTVPSGDGEANLVAAWQTRYSHLSFADAVGIQSHLCEANRSPKQITAAEYGGAANYGYHLDAGKFGVLLQQHCTLKLGVKHVLDHVTHVNSAPSGDIESLGTKHSGQIPGDLFIDCSGLACLLLGQHFDVKFIDKNDVSINDRALATQVPYVGSGKDGTASDHVIASPTIATAQSAGWTWDIGLSSRRGVGYVYSSAHISDEHAERELRAHLAKSIGQAMAETVSARKLTIRAGYRERFWFKNCVAVGMSAGFIEPLEASALALVELSVNMIAAEMPMSRSNMDVVAKRFNQVFAYRWQSIINFLKLHYVLTQRGDSNYWRDVGESSAPPELRELLALWRYRPPSISDFIYLEEVFPAASYQYVLYGMGFTPAAIPLVKTSHQLELGLRYIKENLEKVPKYIAGLPSNRDLIAHIYQYGLQKI